MAPSALATVKPGDAAVEHGRGGLGDLGGVAGGEHRQPGRLGLGGELGDGIEADGDQQGVAGEGLLRAGERAEALVDAGDGHRFDPLAAVGRKDRVRGVDRHSQALQLVGVDLVAAAGGQRLGQARPR